MDLEKLGVELKDKGGIKTHNKLQTTVKGLYAAGDCTGDRQFTHYAEYQGAVGARNILLPLTDPGVMKLFIRITAPVSLGSRIRVTLHREWRVLSIGEVDVFAAQDSPKQRFVVPVSNWESAHGSTSSELHIFHSRTQQERCIFA